ncbi:MAG: Hsp20/alpha crystallin family protein [Thermodesulfobacteriota bacterium]
MTTDKRKTSPDVCSYIDEDGSKLHLEVALPGVKKENIQLRLKEDSFFLSAPRDDLEYVATGAFCCPMNINSVDAKYDNGLLQIEVPFKDVMDGAREIAVH